MFKQAEYLIFDLDDTLYPQTEYTRQCLYNSCSVFQEYYKLRIEDVKRAMDQILNKYGIEYKYIYNEVFNLLSIDGISHLPQMLEQFHKAKPQITPFPNTQKALTYFKQRNFSLGIITDGPVAVQQYKIQNLGIDSYFSDIVYTDSLGISNRKPSTAGFQEFLKRNSVSPLHCVYIGNDPRKDFLPAKQTGMQTVRIRQGEYKNITLDKEHEAQYNVNNIVELMKLIDS